MRVYITDLEAYNNGHLVGEWYQLPMSEDLLAESIENVLNEGKEICEDEHFHEEYFIADYECEYMEIDEYANLTKHNEVAEAMEAMSEYEIKIIKFLLDNHIVSDIFEAIEQRDDVRVYEDQTMEDIAYDLIEECYNLDNIPSIISNNIDYKSIARDLEIEGSYYKFGSDIYEYIG
ncbi:antirestriction protein ArdA [Sulfurimonas sp. NW15]|uniref:antirestriction protein ArdA n=1 Tax=Sulfurimonas sp. NW15 TaxID=2922729 RepID=UPI003DA8580A